MATLCLTPLCIYNTANNESKRPKHTRKHYYGIGKSTIELANIELCQLRTQVVKYKREQVKLKRLTEFNLRSTKSSLRDIQETLEIIEDLYGDEAFEKDQN
jgi:hypothetical protein|tara:strand:+ start:2408 stop:2710 length:303 start_codon:yes stop_codon:yes gene_type:complete